MCQPCTGRHSTIYFLNMKRKSITIYSIIISIIFIFSVVFLVAKLAAEYSYGEERAQRTVTHIISAIKKDGSNFDMQQVAGNLQDYQGLYLYKNSLPVYCYPQKDLSFKPCIDFLLCPLFIYNNNDSYNIDCDSADIYFRNGKAEFF